MRHSHLQSGEVSCRIVKVAGWEISHSQFGYQPFLRAQDSSDCNVVELEQVQSYLKDSTGVRAAGSKATESHHCTNQQRNTVAEMKYGHLKVPETRYLTTNVGANVLKNESEMSNTVGLEEAVDLRLAEHGGRGRKHGVNDEIRASALGEQVCVNLMGSRGGQAGGHSSWCLSSWSMIL